MLEADYEGWLISFDGAAKLSDRRGSSGCILWKLPSWDVVEARGFHFDGITVNEAEYHGLIEGSKMAIARGITDLVIVGDSRIAIQQAQGLIQCLTPGLQLLLGEFEALRPSFKSVKLVHVKREFNAAADYLTTKALVTRSAVVIDDPVELVQLKQLNRIPEKLVKVEPPRSLNEVVKPLGVRDENPPGESSLEDAAAPLTPDAKIFVMTRRQEHLERPQRRDGEGRLRAVHPRSRDVWYCSFREFPEVKDPGYATRGIPYGTDPVTVP